MLSIFATTDYIKEIEEIIQSEDRLSELVNLYDAEEVQLTWRNNSLVIDARGIVQSIDWENERPPYLLQGPLPFEKDILLGLVFHFLGNNEKAWEYLDNYRALLSDMSIRIRLQHHYEISLGEIPMTGINNEYEDYRLGHNMAVTQHYGLLKKAAQYFQIVKWYENALEAAPDYEYYAFTARHFTTLLLDADRLGAAEKLITETLALDISPDASFSLKSILTKVWLKQLTIPYNEKLLENLKNTLWETLQYFEKNNRKAEAALLLIDAAHIANISESFSESLGYITKAIRMLEEEDLTELAGNAHIRKGTLLYTWAQNDNPQFFKPAVESYQQALKIFTKERVPHVFADIQHNLANIFTDMPTDQKKKGIWAGVAVSSFNEALEYYTKDKFPYEYGMINNNYGNAFSKFPQAVLTDHFEKALFYYQEALDVRNANYPYERAITLLNFLEASWKVGNDLEGFNEERYADMLAKAKEVKTLVEDADMLAEADRHLELLAKLKETVA